MMLFFVVVVVFYVWKVTMAHGNANSKQVGMCGWLVMANMGRNFREKHAHGTLLPSSIWKLHCVCNPQGLNIMDIILHWF